MYDLIIVGAGWAGSSAALYAARYKVNFVLISPDFGGITGSIHEIENLPSYPLVSGADLVEKFKEQLDRLDVEIKYEFVTDIQKSDHFTVKTKENTYEAKKLVFTSGTKRRTLDVPGEEEYSGKGVSYCATCDAAFFKDKITAVVGGGDAALTAAIQLAEHCTKVYIIYRGESFTRPEPTWVDVVEKNDKIEVMFKKQIKEIRGEKFVTSVLLDDDFQLDLDGVFIEVGASPDLSCIKDLNVETTHGHIVTNKSQETNVPGFYAAGDVTNGEFKQLVTAGGEGGVAVFHLYHDLKKGK